MGKRNDKHAKKVWKISDCPLLNPCKQKWDDLKAVQNEPKIRHCDKCHQSVYRCDTQAEFREHRALGHCIAIEVELLSGERVPFLGGAPLRGYDPGKPLKWD